MYKTFFSSLLILFFCFMPAKSFAQLDFWNNKMDMYDVIEDLHVNEKTTYSGSPFNPFVQKTFSDDNKKLHYLYVLDIGDEALSSRIHWIRQAKKAIYIQTFIWANDETGRYVAYELLQAAKRGVKVKIIVDQWRLENVDEIAAFMATAHPNMELKVYSPHANQISPSKLRMLGEVSLKFKQVNQRMHNKIFIVDDKVAITGGRNYENDYYDRGTTRNFKDRDVLVIGPVVRDMTFSFMQYWSYQMTLEAKELMDVQMTLKTRDLTKYSENQDFIKSNLMDDIHRKASDSKYIKRTFTDHIYAVDQLRFVYDSPGKNNSLGLSGFSASTAELIKFLEGAEKTITVQTPYLVMDKSMIKAIKRLRKHKPDLDILISSNSLAATDSLYAYSFAFKQKKIFLENLQLRIFELKPVPTDMKEMMPRYLEEGHKEEKELRVLRYGDNKMESSKKHMCIHAKTFILDDKSVWIGSFNIDPRSTHLNTEVGLLIHDPVVAQAVKNNIEKDMAPQNSWTIGKKKQVPVISKVTSILGDVVRQLPFVDLWPFRYTSSFELKEGYDTIPFYHNDFYEHYEDVGSFPEAELSGKEAQIELFKTIGGLAEPLI